MVTRKGHHSSPANGRVFCAQPIGDSHESVPSPTSPSARNRNAAPRRRPPIPYTTRVFSLTCASTRVHAAKNSPNSVNERPNTTDPVAGRPTPSSERVTNAPVTTFMAPTVSSADAGSECRPTARDRTSSARPASSSPRVMRPSMKRLMSPIRINPKVPVWNATCPPTVSRPWAGPLNTIAAALPSDVRAAASRSDCFGYRPLMLPTVATTTSTIDAIHTRMRTRSRRTANRVSGPRPTRELPASAPSTVLSTVVTVRGRPGGWPGRPRGRARRRSAGGRALPTSAGDTRGCARRARRAGRSHR